MSMPAYPSSFVSADGLTTLTFTGHVGGAPVTNPLRTAFATAIGADSQHDFLGYAPAPREPKTIPINWWVTSSTSTGVDTAEAAANAALALIGKGKLYITMADATTRWIWARPTSWAKAYVGSAFGVGLTCSFMCFGNWRASSPTTGSQALTAYQTLVTITNGGNVYVRDGTFTFDATTAGGFTNLSVFNATTGETVSTTRDAETDTSEWQINGDAQAVYYSHDSGFYIGGGYVGESGIGGGTVLADDYSLVTRGATQAGLISLKPGVNQLFIQCDGTPAVTFSYSFDAQYA